jgi:hypothetical protein
MRQMPKKKKKNQRYISKVIALLLAYAGSNFCVFFIQRVFINFYIPNIIVIVLIISYTYLLYHKFKKIEIEEYKNL